MRFTNLIVIHCSATCCDRSYTEHELTTDHLRRGFSGAGYHYYIRRNGDIKTLRPMTQPGAHVRGYNAHSLGICYEGGLDAQGCPADTRTPEQRSALRLLVHQLLKRFRNNVRICGHRDLSPDLNGDGLIEPEEWVKQCPCFDAATILTEPPPPNPACL